MINKDNLNTVWWQGTTIYQIYPRSYQDSNNDGIGDIPGIISRLDYIEWLGIETIWLSPIYPSPQNDFGYDISNYRGIEPDYGTMEDMDRLIGEIHRRGMKLVMDMVLNHTSDKHPWFQESASSRENPKRNWYVWHPGRKDGKQPPNNWQSQVTGKGWQKHPTTKEWFWASFLPFQPDLNWRNPEVEKEMMDTLRFWLDKGVDGFRLDILGSVFETEGFPNNPRTPYFFPNEEKRAMGFFHSNKHTKNHPDNFDLSKRLRALTDEYDPPRFMVGEVFGKAEEVRAFCGDEEAYGLHTVFLFLAAERKFTAENVTTFLDETETLFPPPFQGCLALANHDRIRRISSIGEDLARLNALWQLTGRAIPCLYYGEEIGMPQGRLNHKKSLDAVGAPFRPLPGPLFRFLDNKVHCALNRDNCRQPMVWNNEKNRGFTEEGISTWLPANTLPAEGSLDSQKLMDQSLLNYYRSLISLRKEQLPLKFGSLEVKKGLPKGIAGYERSYNGEKLIILLNFNALEQKIPIALTDIDVLFTSNPEGFPGTIPSMGGLVIREINPT